MNTTDLFKKGFLVLGILAAVGLVGYGLAYMIVMPEVSPDGFVPQSIEAGSNTPSQFGMIQAIFVLLYAFAFLPVSILFTVKKYNVNPYALVFAGSLMCISLLIEIFNGLPVLGAQVYPANLADVSADVMLYLSQRETIRYLSFDVAGFTIAYAAIFIYAVVYFKSHRWLSYTIVASIVLFLANVPCLWFAPKAAVILMAVSIFAFATVPVFLARMAVE
jgi:hypothetical protein